MLRFSANLSFLYQEHTFTDRFAAAAKDGFAAVEYVSPYEEPPERIAALLAENGLTQALFNLPIGNRGAGERGLACLPDRVAEFREGLERAIVYAGALGCTRLNALAGVAPAAADGTLLEKTLVANLRYAARRCEDAGVKLLVEPINTQDMPGYFVPTVEEAERLIDAAGHGNLYLQYDVYHRQMMGGDDLAGTFTRLQNRIAHIQVADAPGRHEPGTGAIDFAPLLRAVAASSYDGWVGCEYVPLGATTAGLGWLDGMR